MSPFRDPLARYMPRWAVVLWWLNSYVLSNRVWHLLPYRLRNRWATEWVEAHGRWDDDGRPE